MDITSFLQNTDYFSLIMIFASGYILLYTIFGKMQEWKNFDSTIKVVLALVVAFGVEFGVILPFFYILPSNFNNIGLFLPAFNATWIYHWAFTGGVVLSFTFIKGREISLRCLNSLAAAGLILFVVLAYASLILLLEYAFIYPQYIVVANNTAFQLFLLGLFDMLGVLFFLLLLEYGGRALDEEKIYGKTNYAYFVKKEVTHFEKIISNISVALFRGYRKFRDSKIRKMLLLVIVFLIIGLIIPIDNYVGIFTPKVFSTARVTDDPCLRNNEIDCAITLLANSLDNPGITATFAQTRCDRYTIQPGLNDLLGTISYPFEKLYENNTKQIRTTFEPSNHGFDEMVVCIPYSLEKNITGKIITDSSPPSLRLDYTNWNRSAFNITFCSWEAIDINNQVHFTSEPIERTPYNSTHTTWKITFEIANRYNQDIYLKSLQYLYFNHQDIVQDSAKVYYNGQYLTYANRNIDTIDIFGYVKLQAGALSRVTFEFVAINEYCY